MNDAEVKTEAKYSVPKDNVGWDLYGNKVLKYPNLLRSELGSANFKQASGLDCCALSNKIYLVSKRIPALVNRLDYVE